MAKQQTNDLETGLADVIGNSNETPIPKPMHVNNDDDHDDLAAFTPEPLEIDEFLKKLQDENIFMIKLPHDIYWAYFALLFHRVWDSKDFVTKHKRLYQTLMILSVVIQIVGIFGMYLMLLEGIATDDIQFSLDDSVLTGGTIISIDSALNDDHDDQMNSNQTFTDRNHNIEFMLRNAN